MSTTVTYKGSTLTTATNDTKTLETAGTYLEDDITVTDTTPTFTTGSLTVTPTTSQQIFNGILPVVDVPTGTSFGYSQISNRTMELAEPEVCDLVEGDTYNVSGEISVGNTLGTITLSGEWVCSYIQYGSTKYSVLPFTDTSGLIYSVQAYLSPLGDGYLLVVFNSTSRKTCVVTTGIVFSKTVDAYKPVTVEAMPSGSARTPTTTITANPTISVDSSTGLITATASASQGITPTVSAGYVSAGTSGTVTVSGSNTSQLTTQAAQTITPTTTSQTAVASGVFTTGAVTVDAIPPQYIVPTGDVSITANGSNIDVSSYATATVAVPSSTPTLQAKTATYTPTTSQQTDTISADNGYDGLSSVGITVNAMPSGTEGTPTATKGTVSGNSVTVTPSVTNTAGYVSGGTHTGTAVTVSASELVSGTYSVTSSGTKDVTNYASASVPAGTEGTPTATKSAVSNNSVTITPSVTNSAGYISGGTHSGTAVSVSASELVSGSETKTANGTYDVTNLAELVVNVSGGTSDWTKIASTELTVNTTSTSAASAGTLALGSAYYTKDKIIMVRIRDKNGKQTGYFYGSDAYFMNFYKANGATTALSVPAVICYRYNNSAYAATAGQYGVYGYSINSSGTLTIRRRYNSNYSLTINSTYTVDVYALDPPSGVTIFD